MSERAGRWLVLMEVGALSASSPPPCVYREPVALITVYEPDRSQTKVTIDRSDPTSSSAQVSRLLIYTPSSAPAITSPAVLERLEAVQSSRTGSQRSNTKYLTLTLPLSLSSSALPKLIATIAYYADARAVRYAS